MSLQSELDAALAWLRAPAAAAAGSEGAVRLKLGALTAQALGALGGASVNGSRRGPALVRSP